MTRLITIIVLSAFIPMQVFAAVGRDFDPVEKEHLNIKPPILQQEYRDNTLNERLMEYQPRPSVQEKSGTNWWLWGGLGLAAVAGGVLALSGKGGSGGGSSSGGASTSTVNVSW